MTKEDLQNRIEQIAYDGATDGCNQAVIEREASKLAREIVKLFAIQNVSKTFTAEEMTDEEIKNSPSLALAFCADKLTPEQFDYCVHRDRWAALKFCADKLTPEQLDYCKERTK